MIKNILLIIVALFFVGCFDDTDDNVLGQYMVISEKPVLIKYNTTEGYFEKEFEVGGLYYL